MNIEHLRKATFYLIKSKKFRKFIIVDFNDDDNQSFIDEYFLIRHRNILFLNFFIEYIDMRAIDLKLKKKSKIEFENVVRTENKIEKILKLDIINAFSKSSTSIDLVLFKIVMTF